MLVGKQLLAKVDNPLETRVRTPRSDFGRFVSTFANPRSLKTTSKCPTRPLSMFVP